MPVASSGLYLNTQEWGYATGSDMKRRHVLSAIGGVPFTYGAVGGVTAVERPSDLEEYETGHEAPEQEVFIFQGDRRIRNLLMTRIIGNIGIRTSRMDHDELTYGDPVIIAQGAPTIASLYALSNQWVSGGTQSGRHRLVRYHARSNDMNSSWYFHIFRTDANQRISLIPAPRFGPHAHHIQFGSNSYLCDWTGLAASGSDWVSPGSYDRKPNYTVDNYNFNLAMAAVDSPTVLEENPRLAWHIRPTRGPSLEVAAAEDAPAQIRYDNSHNQYYCTIQNAETENYVARPEWAGHHALGYDRGDQDLNLVYRGKNRNLGAGDTSWEVRARNSLLLVEHDSELETHYDSVDVNIGHRRMYATTSGTQDGQYYNHLLFRVVAASDVDANGGTDTINENIGQYHAGAGVTWGNSGTFPGSHDLESTYRVADEDPDFPY